MPDQLPLPAASSLDLLRERLEEEETVFFTNGSQLKLVKNSVTVLFGRSRLKVECVFGLGTLDKARRYANEGPPVTRKPRRFPGKPWNYRTPEELAKELRGFHKQGVLKDIAEPEFEEAPPVAAVLPRNQPF